MAKFHNMLAFLDSHLQNATWLAGNEFTAADVMLVFSLTTMRCFFGYDLSGYDGILGYLQRVGGREGYVKAMKKGDPELDWRASMQGKPPPTFGPLKAMMGGGGGKESKA